VANLGLVFANAGRPADAERQFRVAAEHYRDSTGVVGAILLGNFGLVLSQQGKLDSAEPVYRKALAMFDRLPRDYFEKGWSLGNLAVDFILRGRPREALPLAEAQIAHFSRLLSPSHPTVGYGWVYLARSLHALGREEEALRAARKAC
jgi:tetratricopeptide (TPR) repeat protein